MTHEDLSTLVTTVEQRGKSNSHRIDQLEKQQENLEKLISAVAVIADKQTRLEADVGDIKRDIKTMAEKPGKRWESLIDKIVSILVAALMGYALARIGLG